MKLSYPSLKPDEQPITTVAEYFEARNLYEGVKKQRNNLQRELALQRQAGEKQNSVLLEQYKQLKVQSSQMMFEFIRRNPAVLVSICPYCNTEVWQKVGVFSLMDEFWYHLSHTGREVLKESCCPHLFCVDGALNLNGHQPTEQRRPITVVLNENITMAAEVPFIKPRVLNLPTMVAVIHSFPVAERYTAYPIVYFAEKLPPEHLHFCIPWASTAFDGLKPYGLNQSIGFTGRRSDRQEYDLTKWVQQGKLLWVDPVSEDQLVRGLVEAFPYARVTGRRHPYLIEEGQVHDLPDPVQSGPQIEEGDIYR